MGWILGGCAAAMGNSDLEAMGRGRMSRSGEGATQGGRVCGIIAIVLACIAALFICMGIITDRY
jgi:hypothetical protein